MKEQKVGKKKKWVARYYGNALSLGRAAQIPSTGFPQILETLKSPGKLAGPFPGLEKCWKNTTGPKTPGKVLEFFISADPMAKPKLKGEEVGKGNPVFTSVISFRNLASATAIIWL